MRVLKKALNDSTKIYNKQDKDNWLWRHMYFHCKYSKVTILNLVTRWVDEFSPKNTIISLCNCMGDVPKVLQILEKDEDAYYWGLERLLAMELLEKTLGIFRIH